MMFSAVIAKGLAGVERQAHFRCLTLTALTFQQEFTATHPAGTLVSRLRRNAAGMCSFSLYLFTGSHTHTHFLRPPTFLHSFISPISLSCTCRQFKGLFFSTDRIPNMDLALPYQEARTSRIRTMETPRWWFQMCCQMGQPWDDCCKLNSMIMSSWRLYLISLNADNDYLWRFVSLPTKIDSHFCFLNLQHQRPNCHGQRNFYGERPLQPHHSHPQDMRQNC